MNDVFETSRRRFVRLFTVGTVLSVMGGRQWLETLVGEAQAAENGLLTLKVSEFSALLSDYGSVRLALNSFSLSGPSGPFYPILVNRAPGNVFHALSTQCTHAGCVVPVYTGGASGSSQCPCHFSRYAINGDVIQGPAPLALTKYTLTFDGNDKLTIRVPNLGYTVAGSTLQATPGPRFRLDFPTQSGLTYEVRFRQNVTDPGSLASFATTPDGTANQTSLSGNGGTRSIYVDRGTATGFYVVNVRVTQA